ncbi:hypothetical protein GIR35_12315 [Enterococcus faecalis]|nr:hypothetical protein GIR35_12315 [Enterococcus faecalis]
MIDMETIGYCYIIYISLGSIFGVCFLLLFDEGKKVKAVIFMLILIAIFVAMVLQSIFLSLSETGFNETEVVGSWRIAEDGVSLKSNGSNMCYSVTVDDGDEGLRVKRLPVGSTTVHDDAKGWEDARVEKIFSAEYREIRGTFFGIPVSDKKMKGLGSTEYKIFVPASADSFLFNR